MKTLRLLYNLARADFLERLRRSSFLVTVAFTLFVAYLYVPPLDTSYLPISLGGNRGVYNSAWLGSAVAILTSTLFSLPAFYLVKNAIARDRQTNVGQILAATSLTRPQYTLGKAASNAAVLALLAGIIAMATGAMQLIRGEDLQLEPWALLSPFLVIALPAMVLVAAVALLFETVGWLRGSLGNAVYLAAWVATVQGALAVAGVWEEANRVPVTPVPDPFGVTAILARMVADARAAFPE